MTLMVTGIYEFFATLIHKNTGILYLPKDYYRLESRLKALMKKHDIHSLEKLYQIFLDQNSSEIKAELLDLATNNETSFFRDPKMFESLFTTVIPELLKSETSKKLMIWSAGCSNGQEPYSLSMWMHERFPHLPFEIHATDYSLRVLKKAQDGLYDHLEIQRGLSDNQRLHFFEPAPQDNWKVKPFLKENIHFSRFNFVEDSFPYQKYHLIFCRNVLIYQDIESKKKIINKFYQSLTTPGVYLMGAGESIIGFEVPFQQKTVTGHLFFYKL